MQDLWRLDQYQAILAVPFGRIGVVHNGSGLQRLDFLPPDTALYIQPHPLLDELCEQLECYWQAPAFRFELPYTLKGTIHQLNVWKEISDIPSGSVRRYGDIARKIASAPRAVGQACGRNPLPLLIPCHRVVGSAGALGGFNSGRNGFDWLPVKRWLLRHEGVIARD